MDATLLVVLFILWLVFAFVVASMAKERGRDQTGYVLLAIFFSPLLAIIILLIVGDSEEKRQLKRTEDEVMIKSSSGGSTGTGVSDSIKYENLERVGNLLEKGIITKEEFEIEKKRILSSGAIVNDELEEVVESDEEQQLEEPIVEEPVKSKPLDAVTWGVIIFAILLFIVAAYYVSVSK